mmetsp:Transcript_28951/g.43731  ORF Transcript_28951/g.43731 Transcript_28951/m.43731 type:complete len:732 (+) Transcript_28951:146-2341(+)
MDIPSKSKNSESAASSGADANASSRKHRHDTNEGVAQGESGAGKTNKKPRPRRNNNKSANNNNVNGGESNTDSNLSQPAVGDSTNNRIRNNDNDLNNNRNRNNNQKNRNKNRNNKKDSQDEKKMELVGEEVKNESMQIDNPQMEEPDEQKSQKCRHQFSDTTFDSIDSISNNTKKALKEVLSYEYMTKVQKDTLHSILTERFDVVAKAKTGSGKTTAFLLPIIENLAISIKNSNKSHDDDKIVAVILSPTRELANQISNEFLKIATYHPKMKSQLITMIGGTSIEKDKKRLSQQQQVRVIVATPGRLQDHLQQNTANLVERLSHVQTLCLDEADRLLDMGFRKELERIISYMPQQHNTTTSSNNNSHCYQGYRQTLLFSATFPDAIKDITKIAMRPNFKMIDTVVGGKDGDGGDGGNDNNQTNIQVVQKYLIVPLKRHIVALDAILQQHIASQKSESKSYKIIVFFTTARIAGYMAELFRYNCNNKDTNELYLSGKYDAQNLLEMHSRKSQSYRTNVAKQFTNKTNLIMFSSDVSARGVDYPNVSCVVQVGAPSDKAQYIHRLGRTARAGSSGIGVIILSDFERIFIDKEIQDLNLQPYNTDNNDTSAEEEEKAVAKEKQQEECFPLLLNSDEKLKNNAGAAYQAFLGYYNSNVRRLKMQGGKEGLVQLANEYSTVLGFPKGNPPPLQAKTVGKMGLKGVPGLVIEKGFGGGGRGNGGRGHAGRGGGGRGY